jgi:PAS domain S-box-containing protein
MEKHGKDSEESKMMQEIICRNSKLEETIKLIESSSEHSDAWDAYHDHKGELIYISSSFDKLTGHPRKDFNSGYRKITDIIHHEDLNKYHDLNDLSREKNQLQDPSVRIIDPENNPRYFSISLLPMFKADDQPAGSRIRFTREDIDNEEDNNPLYGESLLKLILNHTNQGIILVNEEGNIVGWNKCVEHAMGIPREKVFNEKVWTVQYKLSTEETKNILKEEDFRKMWEDKIFKMQKGQLLTGYGSVKNVSGGIEYIQDMIRPIEINGKKYFTSFQTYYTDYKKVEEELKLKIEELASANRELEVFAFTNNELKQFAYTASHQLQEPARTISNFSRIIEEDYSNVLDHNALNYLFIIRHAAQRMTNLINVLYEYSILGRKSKLTYSDCNKIVEEVIQEMLPLIRESGADVAVQALPKLNIYENEFRLLIKNLLDNAIKFRRQDVRPQIVISSRFTENKFIFSVRDNGIGIDEIHKEKIFDIFQRLHASEEEFEGKGVGLAFCKKIVGLHQGEIWLDNSELNTGSEFCFTIPLK